MEHSYSESGEEDAFLKVEEKMIEIVRIFGISVEGRLGELRTFIAEMEKEEKGRNKVGNQSRKKSKTQRELEKLAFSVNYDLQAVNKQIGVNMLGI